MGRMYAIRRHTGGMSSECKAVFDSEHDAKFYIRLLRKIEPNVKYLSYMVEYFSEKDLRQIEEWRREAAKKEKELLEKKKSENAYKNYCA